MNPQFERLQLKTRRHFLKEAGVGAIALNALFSKEGMGASLPSNPVAPKVPHFPAKAKRVIYLHMTGSPPHLDLFDYKPELVKHDGEDCPDSVLKGRTFAFTSGVPKLLGTPRTFSRHGAGGTWMSDAIPNFHTVADEMAVINSVHTDQFNHAPAELLV